MKRMIICVVCLMISFPVLAAREKESGFKVAYVSLNEAVAKTGEQDKITRSLQKERKRIESVLLKKSEGFKKEAMKIQKEMSLLSDNEKAKKYESIRRMEMQMGQFAKEKDMEFQQKKADLEASVVNKIKKVIEVVAKKKKVDVVRNKDGALWVSPNLDLTDKVVSMYKKKYK